MGWLFPFYRFQGLCFFPSASAAWRISQEKFWKENDWINDVKVRASWGKTGNQAIPLYEFYPAYVINNYTFGNEIATGYLQQKMSNKDLTWETTTQTDIGLDLYASKSRLGITLDYYNKVTDGILLALPIPGVIGLEPPLQNAGSVLNRGVELMLTWRDSFREVSYSVTGNLAVNKNKIQDLAGSGPYKTTSSTDPMTIRAEGLPIDSHWGYLTGGLFQTQEEVDHYPTLFENTKPGDVKYLDLNGDGKITPEDMTYLGNTFPKYTFGLNGTVSWKGFELYMQWQGAADVDVRLTGALIEMGNQEGFTHEIYAGNVWTPENLDARFPRPVKFDLRNVHSSDRVIFDGSYLRLKTLQLAYTIPQHIFRRFYVNRARVSLTGTNLLTFSALNEWNLDPEIPSGRASYYPQTSVYSLGINLEF
ncbi:MAG: SusC/RagA family TonB-linked outer membrane protein [Tannerellaceae bacterium]|nr:SusC/RagA family TonB-linked outer membrane protein [Tannerellaceae bacterium]